MRIIIACLLCVSSVAFAGVRVVPPDVVDPTPVYQAERSALAKQYEADAKAMCKPLPRAEAVKCQKTLTTEFNAALTRLSNNFRADLAEYQAAQKKALVEYNAELAECNAIKVAPDRRSCVTDLKVKFRPY